MKSRPFPIALAGLLAACSSSVDPPVDVGSSPPDSGVLVDAGNPVDTGPADSGVAEDQGVQEDATIPDVGTSTDAIWTASWTRLPMGPAIQGKQDDIYFINELEGWSVNGLGAMYHTSDGGDHWEKLIDQPGTYFRAVLFLDSMNGFVGNIGTDYYPGVTDIRPLFVTHDGGHTLEEVTTITGPTVKGVCNLSKLDDQHLFATGRVGGPTFFLKSSDGGATWTSRAMPEMGMLIDSHFSTPLDGFVVGGTSAGGRSHCTILHTIDGGDNWTTVYTSTAFGLCWKFSFPTNQVGYASMLQSNNTASFVVKTENSGLDWVEKPLLPTPFGGLGIGFINERIGWLGGDSGSFRTNNGGDTWEPVTTLGPYTNRFRFVNGHVGYAIGARVDKFVIP